MSDNKNNNELKNSNRISEINNFIPMSKCKVEPKPNRDPNPLKEYKKKQGVID